MEAKRPGDSRVTLSHVMGPAEANTLGNVHGGIIMKLCDEAGGMAAAKHARHPAVTVTVDSMSFHSPVHIGDLMVVTAEITWVGRTSMETRVVVTAENVLSGVVTHTNTAYFVYVALDGEGRPTAVPPLNLASEDEQARFEAAELRQRHRLAQMRRSRS